MSRLFWAFVFAILSGAGWAYGDQISDMENELELIKLKLAVATEQRKFVILQKELATAEKDIANELMQAAQHDYAAAQKRLERVVPKMRVTSGTLAVARASGPSCNAVPYLRWKCNNEEKCDFIVDERICGLPGASTDPMILSLTFLCGDQTIGEQFAYGKPAYLTCK